MAEIYKSIIIDKQIRKVNNSVMDYGIELYLEYIKDDIIIYDYRRIHLDEYDLINQVLKILKISD